MTDVRDATGTGSSGGTLPPPDPASRDAAIDIRNVEAFLADLAALAARTVAPTVGVSCGITVQTGKQETTVGWSDARAVELDEIQYEVDVGPCLHALRTSEVVLISVMDEAPWPVWRERAAAAGVKSALAVPVPMPSDGPRAALNFYAFVPDAFDDDAVVQGQEMADRAVRAIGLATWLVEQERHAEDLRAAVGSRSVIDQALGIIMGQNRCDADEAFLILRKASHNRNVKLRAIAAEIVTKTTGREPVVPPQFR